MPRQPRYHLIGVPQHVIQRGNNRQATFFSDEDYQRYLADLKIASEQHQCEVHAFVLMTNHVHMLMTPKTKDGIAKTMQNLGRRYVSYINHAYGRTGTLWEGRYKAALIDSEHYLLSCYRYIEMNPVRAEGMAEHPGDYPWSSYRANALGQHNPLLVQHEQYLALGLDDNARQQAYRELFDSQLSAKDLTEIRDSLNQCRIWGSEHFKDQIEKSLSRRVRPGKAGRPKKVQADD